MDKLPGCLFLEQIQVDPLIVLTTGRINSEMLQKAARMGATIVASRGSPTSLSVRLADLWKITLIGYARCDQFTVYAHPENTGIDHNAEYTPVLVATNPVENRSTLGD